MYLGKVECGWSTTKRSNPFTHKSFLYPAQQKQPDYKHKRAEAYKNEWGGAGHLIYNAVSSALCASEALLQDRQLQDDRRERKARRRFSSEQEAQDSQ